MIHLTIRVETTPKECNYCSSAKWTRQPQRGVMVLRVNHVIPSGLGWIFAKFYNRFIPSGLDSA
jgi:hypothetical protein